MFNFIASDFFLLNFCCNKFLSFSNIYNLNVIVFLVFAPPGHPTWSIQGRHIWGNKAGGCFTLPQLESGPQVGWRWKQLPFSFKCEFLKQKVFFLGITALHWPWYVFTGNRSVWRDSNPELMQNNALLIWFFLFTLKRGLRCLCCSWNLSV